MCTYHVINSYDYAIQVLLQMSWNFTKISVESASPQQIGTWSFAISYTTVCNNYKMQIFHFIFAHTVFEASTSFSG